jgi:internalin A
MTPRAAILNRVVEALGRGDGVFDLSRLELTSVPEELMAHAETIRELNLSGNYLSNPEARVFTKLANLAVLDLRVNRLTDFPRGLRSSTLTSLNLDGNGIRRLKIEQADLPLLRFLSVERNGLERIDPTISSLIGLEVLDLSGNLLPELPSQIGQLVKLRELDLSDNPGLVPPASVIRLASLSLLDLTGNHLRSLPPKLGRLPESVDLRLRDNMFEESFERVIKRDDARATLRYIRSLGDTEPNYEAKLLLVGEGNVGKTSLVEALRHRPFVEGRETTHGIEINSIDVLNPHGLTRATHAVDHDLIPEAQHIKADDHIEPVGRPLYNAERTKGAQFKRLLNAPEDPDAERLRRGPFTLRSWDFGGQEVYRVTHQFFFSPNSIYLVVWRPREGHEENAVWPWIGRIRLRVREHAKVIVVATHGEERRPELDVTALRQQFGPMLAGFCTVDSKTGLGLDELASILGSVASTLPQMGEPLNRQWVQARHQLLSTEHSFVKRSTFDRICAALDIDEEDSDVLASLLADLGYIVYFPNEDGLKDIILLQPELLTKAISIVLEDIQTREQGGIIDHRHLSDIWLQHPPYLPHYLHSYLLRLMEKFDVSYRIADSDTSLVGQLVPHEKPPLDWPVEDRDHELLTLECEFAESPPGLIPWLIVRNHRFSTGTHWRHGVLVRHPEYRTEGLYEFVAPTVLRLQVRGRARGFFFDILRDTLTYLCDTRWPGLNYRIFVPCQRAFASTAGRCPGRFPLLSLERLRELESQSVQCIECLETWNVDALLSGFRRSQDSFEHLIHSELVAIRADVERSLLGTRAIIRALATEVSDCPRLFGVDSEAMRRFDPRRTYSGRFSLTLWCEEPGSEHAVAPAYVFRRQREWFADVAPYLLIAARAIAVLAPVVGAASAVFAGGETDLKRISDFMTSLAEASSEQAHDGSRPTESALTWSEGAALRRFRELLFELDPERRFSNLQRVLSPTGDYLWVCAEHHKTYEPGLPVLPS